MNNKNRNVLQREWPFLRAEIERVRKELNVKDIEFGELKINEWKTVETKIEKHFLHERSSNIKRSWLWDDLKTETYGIVCKLDPYEKLNLLIDENEMVYFLVNETVNECTKYWYYEGKIDPIISVIGESQGLDEYYIIS